MAPLPPARTPTDRIEAGLAAIQTRAARRHNLELLQRAPKTLDELLNLAKASESKVARLKERSLSFQLVAVEAKAAATAEAKRLGIADVRRHEYVKQHVDAAVAKWRALNDISVKGEPDDSARLHAEVADMFAVAASIIPRYNSAVGLLQISTSQGDDLRDGASIACCWRMPGVAKSSMRWRSPFKRDRGQGLAQ